MYEWLLLGHLIGVAFLIAGFAIYVANLDRLALSKTVADMRTHLAVVAVGERVLILGGVLLIPSALIMATQFWSLSQGWIATSIALVLIQGAAGAAISFHVRKLHALLDHQDTSVDEIPPQIAALARNLVVQAIDRAAIANLVEIVFLMTVKPTGTDLVLSLAATTLAGHRQQRGVGIEEVGEDAGRDRPHHITDRRARFRTADGSGPRGGLRPSHQQLRAVPDHVCLLVDDWFVLTGDTLFVGDVGRVDLALTDINEAGIRSRAKELYESLQALLSLRDDVEVYPGHYAGSTCGRGMDGKTISTIGRERRTNPALQLDPEQFLDYQLAHTPPLPQDFLKIKSANKS